MRMFVFRPAFLSAVVAMAMAFGPAAVRGQEEPAAAEVEVKPATAFNVHNASVVQKIYPTVWKAPAGAPKAIELAGPRNGTFAAHLVVSADAPIKGLRAAVSDLSGPGTIPGSAVTVRYGVLDGPSPKRGAVGFFDSLESTPPDLAPIIEKSGAVQPLWFSLHIPKDAKPGQYAGTVTVSADGCPAVPVPLKVKVIDWTLGDPTTFTPDIDIIESPESVALAYDVEEWSDQHMALLDKTFATLRPLAVKTLYISAIRRTHFGNENAMIRWYRDDKDELVPDFGIVEKYLDVATKHLGKVPGVVVLCWEPISSMGHAGGTGGAGRTNDKPIQYTLWDRETNKLSKRTGPAWGSPEARVFWKKLTDGLVPVLRKRGLEKSLLFGLIGDSRPTKVAMDDVCNGVKDAQWAVHSHHYCPEWQGYKVGMGIALWGIHLNIIDPSKGHGYGWQNEMWLSYYPREFSLNSSLIELRYKLEMWLGAFSQFEMQKYGESRTARGLGRIGGDFWPVVKGAGGRMDTIAGRYPESYWGQLNLNYCIPYLIGKGKDGPVPTVRSEAMREGIQEAETRIFIEKAVVPDEMRAKLGEELAARARTLLDERIRLVNGAGSPRNDQVSSGAKWGKPELPDDWQKQNERLFEMAAEVAKKLGQ